MHKNETKKTFLITGGSGFIGSHLSVSLLQKGHRVLVIDDLSTGRIKNIASFLRNNNFHFARASITDDIVLDRLSSESDIIIHLAAAVGVKLIVKHPVHTIETNVMGTQNVLKAALRYRCRVLLASSSEVYGKGNSVPFTEDDDVLLGSTSKCRWAYAESKMIDESLALAYNKEFGLDVVPFRLFNTVGPKQTGQYGMVIPSFVKQAMNNDSITVFGDGSQKRCFCDVRDVVRAIVGLAQNAESSGKVFNIGAQEEISIMDLARKIKEKTNSNSKIVTIPYSQAYDDGFEDMQYRKPSIEKIKTAIGWTPKYKLEDILKSIIIYQDEDRPN
ncbi:MAG: NAD-dependent epimerase/dehydratase family protein [Candidatus Hodarchaeales archaeon]|jgi:UDP-glucose 4-epimerase